MYMLLMMRIPNNVKYNFKNGILNINVLNVNIKFPSNSIKYLDLILNTKQRWIHHFNYLYSKISKLTSFLRVIFAISVNIFFLISYSCYIELWKY